MAALSAKNAKATINGSAFTHVGWNVSVAGDVIDTTNTEGNGYQDQITGTVGITATVRAFWDAAANQHASPPNITFGATLTNAFLYTNGTNSSYWSMPSALVVDVKEMADVHDGIKLEFTMKSKGTFSYPA